MGNLLCKNQIHHDSEEYYNVHKDNDNDYLNSQDIIYDTNSLCTICMDSKCCVLLNCGHSNFCYSCIRGLYYYNESHEIPHNCPICREKIRTIKVKYNMIYYI